MKRRLIVGVTLLLFVLNACVSVDSLVDEPAEKRSKSLTNPSVPIAYGVLANSLANSSKNTSYGVL
jgi:hypothetical protein